MKRSLLECRPRFRGSPRRAVPGLLLGAVALGGCGTLLALSPDESVGAADAHAPDATDAVPTDADAGFDADAQLDADAEPGVILKAASSKIWQANASTASFVLNVPSGAAANDVMIAVLAVGHDGSSSSIPVLTTPASWQTADGTGVLNGAPPTLLASYFHVVTAAEPPTYTWSSDVLAEGVAWLGLYSGVDPGMPMTKSINSLAGTSHSTGTLTTSAPNAPLLAVFAGHQVGGTPNSWTAPSPTMVLLNLDNKTTRSMLIAQTFFPDAGPAGPFTATASKAQEYAITSLIAFKPAR